MLKVNVICESKVVLETDCSTGQGKFEIRFRIMVSVRLELGLYNAVRVMVTVIVN